MSEKKSYIRRLREKQKASKASFILVTILRLLVILSAVRHTMRGEYEAMATCILVLALFFVPAVMEDRLKMDIPPIFEGIIYLFIFSAEILGEVNHFYVRIHGWDSMLHTTNGFLCAAVGFSLVYLLNRNHRGIMLTPLYMTLMAFCFSMTVGVIWEFFEFGADRFLGKDMQKDFIVDSFHSVTLDTTGQQTPILVEDITSTTIHTKTGDITINGGFLDIGIIDTMKDLFVNFIGAIVFCTFGFFYCIEKENGEKLSRKGKIAKGLMLRADAIDETDEVE